MAIEGFDYQTFAQELSTQANGLVPKEFENFQREYVVKTIKNFATLCGEAVYNDTNTKFSAEQAMLITQIIAEWSFHKSIDLIKSGILPDYWDGVMQKIAFTIFEISKQAIIQNVSQDEILKVVEHHVKKTYDEEINNLKSRQVIDDEIFSRAINQSNIDDMMEKLQEEKAEEEITTSQQSSNAENSKILKLASVALLLKQMPQDKVKSILNKFNPQDAQTVIQYMQMRDLETKLDQNITMKCLKEIKTSLPEPKFISPAKIVSKMKKVLEKLPTEKVAKLTQKERPNVKEFISMAQDGEYFNMSTKVANIIAQHLEESAS